MDHNCKFEQLKKNMLNIHGEAGAKWVAHLPLMVDQLRDYWKLTQIVPVDNMTFHFVAKAMTETQQPVVLKVGLDSKVILSEKQALDFFDGQAAVHLLDYHAAHHAMLLEQAIPGQSLKSFYPAQVDVVMDAYCQTVQKLHQKKLPKSHSFPHVSEWLTALDHASSDQLPQALITHAIQLKNHLLQTAQNEKVLHGDLHHDNVLQNGNDWIVIDPKGVIGEVEFEMAAFDFVHASEMADKNILHKRIEQLAKKSGFDVERIRDWVFVRLMLSAAWSVEDKSDPTWAINLCEFLPQG